MNWHSEWPIRLEKYYMNASACKLDLSTTSAVYCLCISATDPHFISFQGETKIIYIKGNE